MFHPELRNLIAQDNADMLNPELFLEPQLFMSVVVLFAVTSVAMVGLLIIINGVSFIVALIYGAISYLWLQFWNSLTPGNQWLELATIITTLAAFVFSILAIEDATNEMDSSFKKLKEQIKTKEERIGELEEELERVMLSKRRRNIISDEE